MRWGVGVNYQLVICLRLNDLHHACRTGADRHLSLEIILQNMKLYLLTGAIALFLLGSCSGEAAHSHEDGHTHEACEGHGQEGEHNHDHGDTHESKEGHNPDEIIFTAEKAKASGLETETVKRGAFRRVIATGGQILTAQGEEATVVANTAGVVSFTHPVTEGMQVAKGGTLLSVSSANLQDGDQLKRTRIAYETARREYERAAALVESRIVSQKEFEAIKETYENARLAYEALSPAKNGKGAAVKSPIGGYVKNCLVKEGDYVTVGQPLMSVTQTRRLRLRADVSEKYYGRLQGIRSANFKTSYGNEVYRLDDLKGRLLAYGKSAGEASYYVPVTFEFDNRGDIIPGSFVEVYLLSESLPDIISVPRSALTEEQGLYFVYLRTDTEVYRKREVKLGADDGDRIEVVSGLNEGETVVTRGAMHVKLASASTAIPAHTHNH